MVNVIVRKLEELEKLELGTGFDCSRLPREELKNFLCIELSGFNTGESSETLLGRICECSQVRECLKDRISTASGAVYVPLRQSSTIDAAYVVVKDDKLMLYTANSQVQADTLSLFGVQTEQLHRLRQLVKEMGRFEIGGTGAKAA